MRLAGGATVEKLVKIAKNLFFTQNAAMRTATRPLEQKSMTFCTKKSAVKKSLSVQIRSKIAFVEFSVTTPRLGLGVVTLFMLFLVTSYNIDANFIKHWFFSKIDTDLMSKVILLLELLFFRMNRFLLLPGLG
jgi:hypothetical protein